MNEHVINNNEEIIDIEEHSKSGKPIPPNKKYKIRIDKTQYVVDKSSMISREILALAQKLPAENFRLYQKLKGGQSAVIGYDQEVDFTAPGVERFMVIALDQTEGAY